jgi:hypothetical protein
MRAVYIYSCFSCPSLEGLTCRKTGRRIGNNDGIPSWCPLPKTDDEEESEERGRCICEK